MWTDCCWPLDEIAYHPIEILDPFWCVLRHKFGRSLLMIKKLHNHPVLLNNEIFMKKSRVNIKTYNKTYIDWFLGQKHFVKTL